MKAILVSVAALLFAGSTRLAVAQDRPSVHGMLVVGQERVYLSHLPMFHNPHDYQVILEVELSARAKAAYVQDRKAHPEETVYTLVPERFVLPEMVAHPRPFLAELYRGHFERGGVSIAQGVRVAIAQVLHFHQLDAAASRPAKLQYLAFGETGGETFLAHVISARPDFDQVIAVPDIGGGLPRIVELEGDPESPARLTPGRKQLYLETGDLE